MGFGVLLGPVFQRQSFNEQDVLCKREAEFLKNFSRCILSGPILWCLDPRVPCSKEIPRSGLRAWSS